eukprot:gene18481-biopygen8403
MTTILASRMLAQSAGLPLQTTLRFALMLMALMAHANCVARCIMAPGMQHGIARCIMCCMAHSMQYCIPHCMI